MADQNEGDCDNDEEPDPSDFSIRSELSRSLSSLEEDIGDPWSDLRTLAEAMDDSQCPESPAGEQPDRVEAVDSPDCTILDPPKDKGAAGDSKPSPQVDQIMALLQAVQAKMMTKQPDTPPLILN